MSSKGERKIWKQKERDRRREDFYRHGKISACSFPSFPPPYRLFSPLLPLKRKKEKGKGADTGEKTAGSDLPFNDPVPTPTLALSVLYVYTLSKSFPLSTCFWFILPCSASRTEKKTHLCSRLSFAIHGNRQLLSYSLSYPFFLPITRAAPRTIVLCFFLTGRRLRRRDYSTRKRKDNKTQFLKTEERSG